LVQERIELLFQQGNKINVIFNESILKEILLGKRIIVLDAAVLIEANWFVAVNEIWIATIPPKEVFSFSLIY